MGAATWRPSWLACMAVPELIAAVLLLAAPCFMAANESGRGMERRRNLAWALVAESLATILMCWHSS